MPSPASLSSGSDSEFERDVSRGPKTELIICVSSSARPEAIRWLVEKIRSQKSEGGAELIARVQPPRAKGEDLMLHISASKIKLLEAAEQMELQKYDRDGRLRDFTVEHLEDFLLGDMSVDDFLSTSERQTIVRHELENIRALADEKHIPGNTVNVLYEGQSILQIYQQNNIITQIYPLHEQEALKKLGQKWYSSYKEQPTEEIREYFGEGIALYFTFLGFYTTALLVPMFLGFIQLLLASTETVPFFCVFNVVWTTVFLEVWKRRSNELSFKWGTIGMTSLDEPRSNYHGQMGRDPVSGKYQPQYPRWKTNAKMYLVSVPIVFICMILAFIMMLASFWCEEFVKNYEFESEYKAYYTQIPSITYAALVYIVNLYYRSLATFLTEWENHRTQAQYDRNRVTKLVLFEFVNNFMSLFYIAFIIQDMEMLRNQLAVMLIIQQGFNHIQEALLPFLYRIYTAKMSTFKKHLSFSKGEPGEIPSILKDLPILSEDNTNSYLAYSERGMESYEGTFDDYLEMFVQFGYVVLFSSVYPIAALWAVINNLVEIRADAFKLCKVLQRPIAKRVKDIGAWQRAFEVVGALSIMTNCGLLALSPAMRSSFGLLTATSIDALEIIEDTNDTTTRAISGEAWVLGFVILEHILLGVRFILHKAIPDRPEWVRIELAKKIHESRRALKHEGYLKCRNNLTRRFKTVHGPHKHSFNKRSRENIY